MSAGRYVAYETWWNRQTGPEKMVEEGVRKGEYPEGTKAATWSEYGSQPFAADKQWVGLQFPSASAAAAWITGHRETCDAEVEDCCGIERFTRLSDLREHLDDVSAVALLHL